MVPASALPADMPDLANGEEMLGLQWRPI